MTTHDPSKLLERLIREKSEKTWLEFKHNMADPDAIGRYVSALANGAMLADRDRAFLVFGIENNTRQKLGTSVVLGDLKKGGEVFTNWVSRMIEPKINMEFLDFDHEGKHFAILAIEPSYDRPVRFAGVEYIRIGENVKKLQEFPEHERALWLATGRRKFEDAIALTNQSEEQVFDLLSVNSIYTLSNEPKPKQRQEQLSTLIKMGFVTDNLEGNFNITNLGAITLATDMAAFPSIHGKAVRLIKYSGNNKFNSEFEQELGRGYAVSFSDMIKSIMLSIPSEEEYVDGVRRRTSLYPEIAIREVVANALIHQDFTLSGSGPVIEIYVDRIEISNPGNSLIEPDRILNERRSRNEKLAKTMRGLGLCEERGGGLDKTIFAIERKHLPAPEFISSQNSMRVVLFGPKPFNSLSKAEKQRSCYFHCVIRWINHDYMSNSSLRDRFSVRDEDYQLVSAVISEAIKKGRIVPADPDQGRRNAKYIPYFAA